MSNREESIKEAYLERPSRLTTWSGFPVKEIYTPDDMNGIDYEGEIGQAGEYPFTRGIYSNMYRGKLWTRRQPWGYGVAEDTNKQLKFLLQHGNTGLMVYRDSPTILGIDSDHPLAEGEVGKTGVPLCSVEDMEAVMEGIPSDEVSMTLLCGSAVAPVILSQYIVAAEKQGVNVAGTRGTISGDPIQCYFILSKESNPIDLGIKLWVDTVEYCNRNLPLWHAAYIGVPYNLRDSGINAPQEIAFGLATAMTYIEGTLKRGMNVDDIARRLTFYCSAGIDLFEEVAKFRAMRRMWARIMREKLHAKDPRSWQFRFAVQCSGHSLVPQQPLNNIARTTLETLAAVLGGSQSIFCTTYDEPICLPTKEAQQTALGIQGIIAYESGVPLVTDPLGGSYYVENLTNKMEEEATKILDEIEEMGGFKEAMMNGWIERKIEDGNIQYQTETEKGERLIVGANVLTIPPEDDLTPPGGVLRIAPEKEQEQLVRLKKLKQTRDDDKVRKAIKTLRESAKKGENENLIPYILEATRAYATVEEIMGTIREAYGYSWDPWDMRKSPFKNA